jgi:hypothetical protein
MRQETKRLMEELEKLLQFDPFRTGPSYIENKIIDRLVELNHRGEVMWQQRSRIRWLRFFHLRESQRRKNNKTNRLRRVDGQLTEDSQEMGSLIYSFYMNLYTSEGTENKESVLNTVPAKVTPDMSDQLIAPFREKEVKEAIFQMFPTKALGLDGLLAHFSNVIGPCLVRRSPR